MKTPEGRERVGPLALSMTTSMDANGHYRWPHRWTHRGSLLQKSDFVPQSLIFSLFSVLGTLGMWSMATQFWYSGAARGIFWRAIRFRSQTRWWLWTFAGIICCGIAALRFLFLRLPPLLRKMSVESIITKVNQNSHLEFGVSHLLESVEDRKRQRMQKTISNTVLYTKHILEETKDRYS